MYMYGLLSAIGKTIVSMIITWIVYWSIRTTCYYSILCIIRLTWDLWKRSYLFIKIIILEILDYLLHELKWLKKWIKSVV
jgi:Na+-driven multidrug efflux pump